MPDYPCIVPIHLEMYQIWLGDVVLFELDYGVAESFWIGKTFCRQRVGDPIRPTSLLERGEDGCLVLRRLLESLDDLTVVSQFRLRGIPMGLRFLARER